MSQLDDVVIITLTNESQAVTTESFQIPLILSAFTNFSDIARTYASITAVGSDFASTSNVYIIAEKLFGQSGVIGAVPPSIVVGRRQVDSISGTVTVANNTVYSLTVNGNTFSFTSSASATAINIVTGLKGVVGSPTDFNMVNNNDGTFVLTPHTAGTPWSVLSTSNVLLTNAAPTQTIVAALQAVQMVNDTWYLVVTDSHISSEVSALSDAVNAQRKIFGTSTSDVTTIATTTTDIASILSAKSASRTYGVYSPTAGTEFAEAVWAGSQLAPTPGSNDWDFKQGQGLTVSALTSTSITNLRNKNCNFYIAKGGVNVFQDGNMFDGNPIDTIIGEDWLYARLQEGIYFRLINSLKIPMTNPGLLIIENEIRSVLSQAESNGLIDKGWNVVTPDVLSISANDRANRIARTFQFNCRLQGSVRSIAITGFLSV